jgi:tetratricopeptide (TPR) repeat protein
MLRVIKEVEPPRPSTRLSHSGALPSIAAQRQMEPQKLTGLVRGELDWIVMKALEKNRGRRYETANGLATDVQRYLTGEPVQAAPASQWYRVRKFARRNRGPVIAASVIAFCLLAGMIGTAAGMIWAVKERDAKGKALVAEKQARENAMAALRDMTAEIVENQMARGTTLTDENKEFLRNIIKHFEGFAAITADDAEGRSIRAEGFARVGLMRAHLGELKEAEAAYADALALQKRLAADFPTRAEFRQDLANSHNNLGNLLADTGRLKEAEVAFADALALRKQLAADFPTRPEFREDLARSHHNLGLLLANTGRPKEAEAGYADALAIQKQLAADFPTRPEFRQGLAISHNNLGFLLANTGRPKEAEAAYIDAVVIQKQLAADFPTRPEFRQELARSHNNLGLLLANTGRLKEAEAAYIDALAIDRRLAADFPTRPEFRRGLAGRHNNLGILLADTGRLKEAEAAYVDALAIQKQLAVDLPNQPDLRNGLAGTFVNLALVCNRRRDFAAAQSHLAEAQPHHQAALKANPRHPDYRLFYHNNLMALVAADAGLRDQAGAARAAAQLRDLGWRPPGNAYDAACALALCIPIVQKDDKLSTEQRASAVQFYGDGAMKMLKEAVARGWKNADHMKKDTDLNPLRDREDFKALIAELEAGQK